VSIRVAIAQINPKLGDLCANLALYEEKIRQGIEQKAELLVFPELSLTGYYLRDTVPSVALTMDSPEMNRLKKLSRELPFIAGLVEESADHRFFNAAVYFEDGAVRHVHRKVYLPTYCMFDEQRYNGRYWEMINSAYTETFSLFMIYGNRCGFEDGVGFWGGSEIVDPFGQRIAKAKYYDEDFIVADLAFESVRRKRTMSPLLRDEDIDLTINELMRIRERPGAQKVVQPFMNSKVRKLKASRTRKR